MRSRNSLLELYYYHLPVKLDSVCSVNLPKELWLKHQLLPVAAGSQASPWFLTGKWRVGGKIQKVKADSLDLRDQVGELQRHRQMDEWMDR